MKSNLFSLDATTIVIDSSANDGKIALGASPNSSVAGTNKGIYMDGQGDFLAYGDAQNYIKFDASATSIDMKSDTFGLGTATMVISSSVNSGTFRMGTNGGPIAYNTAAAGIYMDGTGRFQVYGDSDNYLRIDGSTIDMRTTTFYLSGSDITLKSPDFYLGDTSNYISGSGGNLAIYSTGNTTLSGSSINLKTPHMFLGATGSAYVSASAGDLEISSSNFFLKSDGSLNAGAGNLTLDTSGNVVMAGTVTATAGYIGGIAINTGSLQTIDPSGNNDYLEIDNAANSVTFYKDGTKKAHIRTTADPIGIGSGLYVDSISQLVINEGIIEAERSITYDSSTCCFVRGTKINTENGLKNIEDLEIGDLVWSYDFDNNKLKLIPILTQTNPMRSRLVEITFADKTKLTCTRDHPLYSDTKGWISFDPEETRLKYGNEVPELLECNQIEVNDEILDGFNGNGTIISIRPLEHGSTETFIFQTEFRNFFAEGKLSHNKAGCGFGYGIAGGPSQKMSTITGKMNFAGDDLNITPDANAANAGKHIAAGVYGLSTGSNEGAVDHVGVYGYANGTVQAARVGKDYMSGLFRGEDVAIDQTLWIGGSRPRHGVGMAAGVKGSIMLGGVDASGDYTEPTTAAAGGIVWGNDTNLYRSAANTLKTDDSLTIGGHLTAPLTMSEGSSTDTAIDFFNDGQSQWIFGYDDSENRMSLDYANTAGLGGMTYQAWSFLGTYTYTTSYKQHVHPRTSATYDLGSTTLRWRNVYTTDLQLSNLDKEEGNKVDGTKGDWTLQEGEEDLFVINNISGKKYKIALIPQNDGLDNKGDT